MARNEINKHILDALKTVIDLPDGIRNLEVCIGVDIMPEVTLTMIVRKKNQNERTEISTVTKRYTLVEIAEDTETTPQSIAEDA